MAKRSLKASEFGIKKAKQAFRRTGWTQEYLASAVGLETRQSVWKFFSGRPIERHLFIDICFQLNLEWEEIVAPPDEDESENVILHDSSNLEQDTPLVTEKIKELIQSQCSLLQVSLDTPYSLAVEQVYTEMQMLLTPSNQRWIDIENLQDEKGYRNCKTTQQREKRLPISDLLAAHNKLVIFGKPGSGKTTLLQHIAMQWADGHLVLDRIPIFISLKTFATDAGVKGDFNLEKQIEAQWSKAGLLPAQISPLLQNGNVMVLLDGLDEVSSKDNCELSHQIQKFADTYPQSTILITCRIAAQDYQFRGFTYVELANFDASQIATFARRWFLAMSQEQKETATFSEPSSLTLTSQSVTSAELIGLAKAEQFLQQLNHPANKLIRDIATTPLLLHLTCLVFNEQETFPTKRAKLYQAGLDIMLVRWDRARGIQRDPGTANLSLPETLNLLSQIAFTFFEKGKTYFEKSEVLPIITDFLQTRSNTSFDQEELWLTSETVLRLISLQSGLLIERARDIYSFSHLTFQEYLTARNIAARCFKEKIDPLHQLASHTVDWRWNEVILLTLSLLPKADQLLQAMRKNIASIVAESNTLQYALQWANQQVETAPTQYKPSAVKAFYLSLCYNQDISLALSIDGTFAIDLAPELAKDLAIIRTYWQAQQITDYPIYDRLLDLWSGLDFGRQFPSEIGLNQALERLKNEFPNLESDELEWQAWWQQNREIWLKQFHEDILKPQNLDFVRSLSLLEKQKLWEYYKVNQFLVTCLNSEHLIAPCVRSDIENMLMSDFSAPELLLSAST